MSMYIKTEIEVKKLIELRTLEASEENLTTNKSAYFFQVVKTTQEKGKSTIGQKNKIEIAINNNDIPSALLIKLLKIIDHWVEKDGLSRDAQSDLVCLHPSVIKELMALEVEGNDGFVLRLLSWLSIIVDIESPLSHQEALTIGADKMLDDLFASGDHSERHKGFAKTIVRLVRENYNAQPQEPAEPAITLDGMNRILTYIQRTVTESSSISESQAIDFANILEHLIFVTQTMGGELPTREEIIKRFSDQSYSQDYPDLGETIADLLHKNVTSVGEQAEAKDLQG